ncbi:hypothetical protein BDA96_03G153400 [Sorghum bicolor]|uniref:Uncharacterized protein n=2 Tax=Sorghum bicolor TaxID=4558 RepID=A0A921REC6_SORBI|nr:uncharacterized protein LOC8078182 isoform X2 [Sorghum bicolor]KAG0537495.1 hypothetical protein BDA96_03G153400 [Sorghum bicolor]KXG32379.1 hypothetical protein SORBI_3003G145700 [Sorghum bicolor]|eukprot:XP_021310884.1 uncharacterized protein LOC8078182 isoform X2 [Sorghum bicolor]
MSVPGVVSPAADRFYCPPARRHLLDKQHKQHPPLTASAAEGPAKPPTPEELRRDPFPSPATAATNLESFIASTAVRVPARCPPRTGTRGCRAGAPYYELADLWEAFGEWSAYGAGVPLLLNGTDGVVQYYVPFLSAIQLYGSRPPPSSKRCLNEDSDGDSALDTSSDVSNESDNDNERSIGTTTQCLAENICTDQESLSSDDCESSNQQPSPVFQYVEHDAPYGRQPLADMISVFACKFPDLNTYKSCDLLPSSWISVAWYPIYRIPTGPTLQDLDACFLTFHSLSTAPDGTISGCPETNNFHNNKIAAVPGKITLPLIGLASYKFNGSLWTSNQHHEQQLTTSLLKAADDWLCQRQVDHPDYRFFLTH